MANGPLGGFMPTPAAPAQPPQVKLDTTADSRGNFNNFLKSMNGAMSLNPPSMAPAMGAMAPNMAPALSNIDIFDQPVSMMQQGGNVPPRNTNIMGQPHMLAYITPQEGQLLENLGGANQPGPMGIPSFFDVGEGMGGFGTEGSAVSGGSESSDDDESTVDDDPVAGFDFDEDTGSFDVVSTPTVTEQEQQQNIAEADQFVRGLDSSPTTIANKNVKFTDLNQNQINEIRASINDRNEKALTEEDNFFNKDGSMNQAGKDELSKRNEADFQLVSAGQVLPSEYLSTASDILGTGEKSVMDALDLTKPIDPFDIQPTVITTPAALGLPTVASRFNVTPNVTTQTTTKLSPGDALQSNVEQQRLAEAGRALGPTTFSDDLANFKSRVTDQEGGVGQGFDEVDRAEKDRLRDELLREGEIAQNFRRADYNLPSNMSLNDLIAATTPGTRLYEATRGGDLSMFKGDPFAPNPLMERNLQDGTTQTTAADRGLGTSGLTKDDIKNIQDAADRDLLARSVEDKSRMFSPSKNIFGFNVPNVAGRFANKISETVDRQVMRDITEKGFQPVYDRDGTITGSRDPNTGILMSGMDFNIQERAEGDNDPIQDVIRRPLTPKPEVDKPDLPPNVIGGTGGQIGSLSPIVADTVVASPFAPASSNIQPISFDSGELNKLIELLTGVAARPVVSAKKGGLIGMANGGLIKAVDDFLAAS